MGQLCSYSAACTRRVLLWALLLLLVHRQCSAVEQHQLQPRLAARQRQAEQAAPPQPPRVHVYQMPDHLTLTATSEFGVHPGTVLLERLLRSPYYEPDPAKADYFWIPTSGRMQSTQVLLDVLRYIREEQPWWNMTVAKGQARHIMVTTRDSDPGQSFGWPLNLTSHLAEYNPVNPDRNIIFLSFNGMRDRESDDGPAGGKDHCTVCFQAGKDIMIPKFQGVCNGPLCGVDLQTLRAKSIWATPADQLLSKVTRRRKRLMFFGGSTVDHHDFTGRGGAALYYGSNKRYLIQVSGGSRRQLSFPDAMLNSEFCLSPLGGNGGPTDRYVPSVMFGCIPVMLNSSHTLRYRTPHALPLEEVLPWHKFATVADNWDIENLDKQLQCLVPRLAEMRAHLKEVWPSLVYTSLNKEPFLDETGHNDAFATLMRVLAARIPHKYRSAPQAAAAFKHPGTLFPCRPDSLVEDGSAAVEALDIPPVAS